MEVKKFGEGAAVLICNIEQYNHITHLKESFGLENEQIYLCGDKER